MAEQNSAFQSAVSELLDIVIFENWLRFYFISDKPDQPDKLFISIPEKAIGRLKEMHPFYMPMVEELNNKEINFESSKQAIATFIALNVEGKVIADKMAETVFDSNTFHNELQVFNTWVQIHEAQLDKGFLDFSAWLRLFKEWRNSDAVVNFLNESAKATSIIGSDKIQ